LELLTPSSMIVYSKKALDENNQDLRKVIAPGTGAFMFKERKVAEKWVMVRNPNYWDPEIPYLDGIELLHIPAWPDRGTAVLKGLPGYRADKTADIAEAKKLMAAAGLADGVKNVDFVSASVAPHAEILAPAFQEELRRTLGIETKIRVMERALLIEELKKGTFDMMVQTEYRSPIGDPGPGWEMCLKTGGSLNFSRYSNPDFDKRL